MRWCEMPQPFSPKLPNQATTLVTLFFSRIQNYPPSLHDKRRLMKGSFTGKRWIGQFITRSLKSTAREPGNYYIACMILQCRLSINSLSPPCFSRATPLPLSSKH
jgi:hypothetical protein